MLVCAHCVDYPPATPHSCAPSFQERGPGSGFVDQDSVGSRPEAEFRESKCLMQGEHQLHVLVGTRLLLPEYLMHPLNPFTQV